MKEYQSIALRQIVIHVKLSLLTVAMKRKNGRLAANCSKNRIGWHVHGFLSQLISISKKNGDGMMVIFEYCFVLSAPVCHDDPPWAGATKAAYASNPRAFTSASPSFVIRER
ncbi:MAG: hypothetical protein ACYC2E_05705 [Sulfuricella sp.]